MAYMLNQMFSSVGAERVRCLARFSGDGPRCIFFGKYILLSTFQGIFFLSINNNTCITIQFIRNLLHAHGLQFNGILEYL